MSNSDDIVKKYENILGANYEVLIKIPVMYDAYKARAKKKNIKFTIPFAAFDHLLKQPCYFCKVKKPMDVAGIDRMDNDYGYITGNCLPCCWDCNRAKSNQSMQEFCSYLKRFNPDLDISEAPKTLRWSNF